jgi:hypothetical protein
VDAGRARGDRAEYDVGGRQREVIGVVFTDPEVVRPDLVGQDTLFDKVPDRSGMGERAVVIVVGDIAEGVQAENKWEPCRFTRGSCDGVRRCCGNVESFCLVVGMS